MKEQRTLEELNQTKLSQTVEKLVSKEYLAEHSLTLAAAMFEYLTEVLAEPEETKYNKYIAEVARDVLQQLEWIENGVQKIYQVLTVYRSDEETEETDEPLTEENDPDIADLLERATTNDPEIWKLGNVGIQMLDNMQTWYNLEPAFPELL